MLKTEFLILIPDDESFCSNKKAFVDFLKIDAQISISGQKIIYKKSVKAKEQVSARFWVETAKVKSKQERYFLLTLECQEQTLVDEFSGLCDRIKSIVERISPGSTAINTIWDGVGGLYAEKAYPIINEVENLMRRLITKFMLITVGMNWSKDAIDPELFKKMESYEDEELYLNDLYKLDFIHLKQVLFDKKRDISLEEMDRLLAKTKFSDEDKEKILKYVPKSNWEKYFSSLLDEKDSSLEKKWELLYKLRNKVAHNRHVKKEEFEQIKGLANDIKEIIAKASAKLGEIDLNEEDRELIIFTYQSTSPAALEFLSEKAVADYYIKLGYKVTTSPIGRAFDFIASNEAGKIAVEVKTLKPRHFYPMMRMIGERKVKNWLHDLEVDQLAKIHLVCLLREDDYSKYPMNRVYKHASDFLDMFGDKVEFHFGQLNDENVYIPVQF